MEKWADFVITAKRMNAAGTHIDYVRAHPDTGDQIAAGASTPRLVVVESIKRGVTFVTAYKNDAGNWTKGARVIIETVEGVEYIKTVPDRTKRDNLDNLPDF